MNQVTKPQSTAINALPSHYALPDSIRIAYEHLGRTIDSSPDSTNEMSYCKVTMEYKLIVDAINAGLPMITKKDILEKNNGEPNKHVLSHQEILFQLTNAWIDRCKATANAAMWFVENPCYPYVHEVKERLIRLASNQDTIIVVHKEQSQLSGIFVDR